MRQSLRDKITDQFFLILVAIVAYWPVSFMVLSIKNDAINYFLAMRYNTSEAIQRGYFPSWSAYINMGYPLHADMQAGVWNPVVFLMSLVRKYDIYWLHVETIIVIIISGISMYHLLRHFKLDRRIVLAGACAYMLNGYMTDSGQFLNWMYAAAFLPFVFLCTLRAVSSFQLKDAFLLGFAYSLMLLCAYPADFILLTYITAVFLLFSFWRYSRQYGYKMAFGKYAKLLATAAISFAIICLPAIISYIPFIQSITRGSGINMETALSNSMAPANLISFITPWATQKGTAFEATDPLIRNCYPGILLFVFFILSFFQRSKRTFTENFLSGLFIFFIIFSLGELGGIRVLAYHLLPLMNTFRHPANAKLFFISAAQILALLAVQRYLDSGGSQKGLLKKFIAAMLLLVTGSLIFSFINSNIFSVLKSGSSHGSWAARLKMIKNDLSFYDLLFLNSLVLLPVLFIFYRVVNRQKLLKYFLPLVVVEMIIITQGMLPLTYVRSSSPAVVQQILDQQPKGYPLPDSFRSIREYSTDGMKYFDQIGCLNPFNKKPGRSDYIITPANLGTQEKFWNYTSFREKIMDYPLAYFADTVYSKKDTAVFTSTSSDKRACIADLDLQHFVIGDSTFSRSIQFRKFVPGRIELQTESSQQELLVLLQNKYPNWEVQVDGSVKPLISAHLAFMGVILPAGKHKVEFVYTTGPVKYLGIFSLLFILTGIIFIFVSKKKETV